jgi:hypothetical protein
MPVKLVSFITLALILSINGYPGPHDNTSPELVFSGYLEAMIAGDWNEVAEYWLEKEVTASHRLGIVYVDVPVKIECASPLFTHLDHIRSGDIRLAVRTREKSSDYARMQVILQAPNDSLESQYFLIRTDDGWKLQSSLSRATRNWQNLSTKYFDLFYRNPAILNEFALDSLDGFVDYIGRELGIDSDRMKSLHEVKIPYYLCSENDIAEITGFKCQGIVDLPHDAIISRQLPHYHELVHLLINYDLAEVPLYTQPFLQEGLAVAYGGRWGKSPEVILQMGQFILANDFLELQDLLSHDGFHRKIGSPDLSYPVAGILTRYLIEKFGIDSFKSLYLRLSGTSDEVTSMTWRTVKAEIETIYHKSWDEITSEFQEYSQKYAHSGIIPGGEIPASEPDRTLESDSVTVRIWQAEEFLRFEIISSSKQPEGVILITPARSVNMKYQSWVFEDQLPDKDYRGEVLGIHFTAAEVGLYHYPTNNLLAKYVYSFRPDERYWSEANGILKFSLSRAGFNIHLDACDIYVVDN